MLPTATRKLPTTPDEPQGVVRGIEGRSEADEHGHCVLDDPPP